MKRVHVESTLRRVIRRMAARARGVANDEVPSATIRQVARIVQHLVASGDLHKARISGKNVRCFTSKEAAEAWLDAAALAKRQAVIARAQERERAPPEPVEKTAPWPADAKPYFPRDAFGRAAWKHTVYAASQLGLVHTNTHSDTH